MEPARDVPPKGSSQRRSLAHALRKARAPPATRVMQASKQRATHPDHSRVGRRVIAGAAACLAFRRMSPPVLRAVRTSQRKPPFPPGLKIVRRNLLPDRARGTVADELGSSSQRVLMPVPGVARPHRMRKERGRTGPTWAKREAANGPCPWLRRAGRTGAQAAATADENGVGTAATAPA